MKNTLTKAGLTFLILSLAACGGNDSAEPAAPDMSAPPPYPLVGESFVYTKNKLEPVIHNNAKDENVLHDLNAVYLDGVRIPLPIKGKFYVNDRTPYVVEGKPYKIFIANNRDGLAYSRYAYLADFYNTKKIYSFSGVGTRDMPKRGVANYKGDAIHTFVDGIGREYITEADAKASIDFGKPNKDAMLTVTISPKASSQVAFKTFDFGARVEDHFFNGENTFGTFSQDKAMKELKKDRSTIVSEGQFNGPDARELVGHYKISRNSEYPNGAEGVFGLKKDQ